MLFDDFPNISNENISLHKLNLSDLGSLSKLVSDKEVYRLEPTFLAERNCRDLKEFISEECDRLLKDKSSIILGVYLDDSLAGLAELYGYSRLRKKISIGYRLRKEVWGKGIGTSLVSLLKDYLFKETEIRRITAHVRIDNPASAKCLTNNGFKQRRKEHLEDWGYETETMAIKYVYYSDSKDLGELK